MNLLLELLDFWWQPCLLILLVLVIRAAFQKQLSAKTRYKLWLLPLIRILIPIRFLPGPHIQSLYFNGSSLNDAIGQDVLINFTVSNHLIEDTLSLNSFMLFIYVLISVVLLVFTIVKNYCSLQDLKWSRKPLPYFNSKLVYESDRIDGALTIGIGSKALIYLPSSFVNTKSKQELDFIIAHEYGHLKQRDFIWNMLRITILIFAWYNPLIWLAVICSKHDAELAADAFTLDVFGKDLRQDYAKVLVGQESQSKAKLAAAFTLDLGFSSAYSSLKKRVEHLYQKDETSKRAKRLRLLANIVFLPILLAALYLSFSYGQIGSYQFNKIEDPILEAIPSETTYEYDFSDDKSQLEPTSETTVIDEHIVYLTDQYGNTSGSQVIK